LVTEPLLADLGIGRVSYANVNLWATLLGAALCLPCGRLLDRFGSRIVLTTVVAALGVTVLFMSASEGISSLYVTVTLTRGFGQSALSVASLALVGMWFARRLNVAMGIYSVLVGMGFIAAFPAVGAAVLSMGWRSAWLAIGLTLVLFVAPVAWILVRDNPEREGLVLDGEAGDGDRRLRDLGVWDALQSPAFWIFALSSSIFGLVYSGIALFNQSILEERGFDASTYHRVLVISTLLGLAANFGGGVLASRIAIQRVMGIGMAVLAAALLGLPSVSTQTHVVLYAMAMGIAGGVVTVVFFSVWGQVFGRRHLGRIQGCAQMMTVFASAVGPLVLATTLESTGSYDSIFYILAAAVVILGAGCFTVSLPERAPELAAGGVSA
ncbi:MAG TPA: MFS transporter, partial [Vicinamibacteria bacterium]|nr:MFS transporter [Vicinamibacteria bacterium]